MKNVTMFPGVTEVTVPASEPEKPDLDPVIVDLLTRYQGLGGEVKRQCSSALSFDLHLEITELHRLTDEILN